MGPFFEKVAPSRISRPYWEYFRIKLIGVHLLISPISVEQTVKSIKSYHFVPPYFNEEFYHVIEI